MKTPRHIRIICLLFALIMLVMSVACSSDTPPQSDQENPAILKTPDIILREDGTIDIHSDESGVIFEINIGSDIIATEETVFTLPHSCKFAVRAVNPDTGAMSEWSEMFTFIRTEENTPAQLAIPTNLRIVDDHYLDFDLVEGANLYEIAFDGSPAFSCKKGPVELPVLPLTLQVRARNVDTGAMSEWSESFLFSPSEENPPAPLAVPTNLRIVDEHYLDFDLVEGANLYEVAFDGSPAFSCEGGPVGLPMFPLTLQLRAVNVDTGAMSEWSEPFAYDGGSSMPDAPDQPSEPTGLQIPAVTTYEDGWMLIVPVPNATHYELRIEDEIKILTAPSYHFDEDTKFAIRAYNERTGEYSDWSPVYSISPRQETPPEPNVPEIVDLETPIVSVDRFGVMTIENYDEDLTYSIEYPNKTIKIYYPEISHRTLLPLTPAKIYASTPTSDGKVKSPAAEVMFTPGDSILFNTETNPISNLQPLGDGSYVMTAISTSGKEYRFRLDGDFLPCEEGWGTLTAGSSFYSLDAVHGVFLFDFAGVDGSPLEGHSIGYSLYGNDHIEHADELDIWHQFFSNSSTGSPVQEFPNYFALGFPSYEGNTSSEPTSIESFAIYMTGEESVLEYATTHEFFYRVVYLSGSPFSTQHTDHLLKLYFRNGDKIAENSVDTKGDARFVALLDANGNEITDLESYYVQTGDIARLEIIDGYTVDVPIVKETLTGAINSNDSRPNSFSATTGTMNTLVIPIYWTDQADRANEQHMDLIRRALGNITDGNGNVTTYAPIDPDELSLSAYYDIASYGKLTLNSFVTDWYAFDSTYDDIRERPLTEFEINAILQWVKDSHPDLELSQFDSDRDGIFDEIILINTGDMQGYNSYGMNSTAGAHRTMNAYGDYEQPADGTPEDPTYYHHININLGFLFPNDCIGGTDALETTVLIHEFGHSLGLWDYYDTAYTGIAALGGYDMMDQNVGDWNVFSKFTAGWITPTIVRASDFGADNTLTFTLRSSTLTGDALLIPAAGYEYTGSPYDEYLMIDLFTAEGLHQKDSALYGLQDAVGVRIYHVDDRLIKTASGEMHADIPTYFYGMRNFTNDGAGVWSKQFDIHQLEIISSTGINHFTSRTEENTSFTAEDLFLAGDSFAAEEFTEFFYKGKMDSGLAFGYTVTVESIALLDGEYVATITLTKNTD